MFCCGDLTILLLGLAFHCFYHKKEKIATPQPPQAIAQRFCSMGIYRRAGETNHWIVDHNLEMPMTLKLYNGIDEVFTYSPTEEQWWITGFNPYIQNVNANDLTAIYTIDFSDFEDLYESFIKSDDYLRNKSKWHISEENKYILTFTWRGEECVE